MSAVAMRYLPRVSGWGYAIFYIAFVYAPVLIIPIFSFNDSIFIALPLKGFTLGWYTELFAHPDGLAKSLLASLQIGIAASLFSTILGTLGAMAATRYQMRGKAPVIGLIMCPLVLPGLIMGISLLIVANLTGLALSKVTILIGHVIICVPFSMAVMMSRMEGFPAELEQASRDLGENAWHTFWRVTYPLSMPGIVASLLLCFTISFDEFVMAFFLAGNEVTLPLYIYSQMRFPARLPTALALSTLILATSFMLVYLAERFRTTGKPKS